jgi:hypothetical protein
MNAVLPPLTLSPATSIASYRVTVQRARPQSPRARDSTATSERSRPRSERNGLACALIGIVERSQPLEQRRRDDPRCQIDGQAWRRSSHAPPPGRNVFGRVMCPHSHRFEENVLDHSEEEAGRLVQYFDPPFRHVEVELRDVKDIRRVPTGASDETA